MDNKVTLSFDADVISKAKQYAEENGISLSRLTEVLLRKVTAGTYINMEDMPVSDWVNVLSEGSAEYGNKAKKSKSLKDEYYNSKK